MSAFISAVIGNVALNGIKQIVLIEMNNLKCLIMWLLLATTIMPTMAENGTKLEAEDANYTNCTLVRDSRYSGGKAIEMTDEHAKLTFVFHAEEKGKYMVSVGYDGLYGDKEVVLSVGGNKGTFVTRGRGETTVGTFFMGQGNNTIVITPNWTWFRIDYIRIEKNDNSLAFSIQPSPVDPQAADCARILYSFLYDNFGRKSISGMMTGDMTSANGDITQHDDVKAVYQVSGKHPALVGFDFMNATGAQGNDPWARDYTNAAIILAKDLWQKGGIPNFTWHWRDPSRKTWEFYTDRCNMKITDALNADGTWNTSSQLYRNIINDIDEVADYFLDLQKDGVACIFRPLHEASGGWFWWGREGAGPFLKLYHLVFEEMVNVKGVHNVIWVWNAGEHDTDWNPGDEYYDVVSADIYNPNYDYSSNYVTFDKLKALTEGKKIIALSENGPIPDIEKEVEEEAVWSWWMPWYQTWGGNFVNQTSREQWIKCMNDNRVVTLEDLSAGWDAYAGISYQETEPTPHTAIYDLQGRRLTKAPSKGLYIKGGKVLMGK